ncbi:nucleotide cyclase [Lucifera butyrica]|uniref:Nucleotide cyclase n=1 Tax=Lucifera butyrica TaxID=1351585 RepID=A0A498R703_9FIRM|nr:ABC transporter substrate binding protein [Lucifera butyrica]VBB06979.1 nucleotide cyclase [Lucifera butyrica]
MRFRKIAVLSALWMAVFLSGIFPAIAAQAQRHILILNSYNRGLPWTDEQTEGMLAALRQADSAADIHVEYLDWKYNPTEENLNLLYGLFRARYARRPVDLILTTDDAALHFALVHRQELFANAPVVFSGVTRDEAAALTRGEQNVTGVYEDVDAEGTLRLMLRLNPALERVYLLYDSSESGLASRRAFDAALRRIPARLDVVDLHELTDDKVKEVLRNAPDRSAVLMASYSRDGAGLVMEPERFVKDFSEASRVPVYLLYQFELGYGAVGGSLISGRQDGARAARMGLRLMSGEPAEGLPAAGSNAGQVMLDYRQLLKYKLPVENVPPNSTGIHRPVSYYGQNRKTVWITVALIVLMGTYMLFLQLNIRRRKMAEENLRRSNEEITALYEEILASQEELQSQYEELSSTQEALFKSKERYELSFAGANDGLWDWDMAGNQVYMSARCREMLSLSTPVIKGLGSFLKEKVPPAEVEAVLTGLEEHLQGKTEYYVCEHQINTPEGIRWVLVRGKALIDQRGQAVRMAGSMTDITDRKQSEMAVNYLAFHDSLTGLANRASLRERLCSVLQQSVAGALLFIDIDNFKLINDTFGHSYGDKLLVKIGRQLQNVNGELPFVARMGGDEFVVLLEQPDAEAVSLYASRVLKTLSEPVQVGEKTLHISVSIGITLFPADGDTAEILLKNADMAMYRAKGQGKNQFAFFEKAMDDVMRHKMMMEQSLREALDADELCLWYQPQIDMYSGKIRGFEALLRWNSKEYGLVMPLQFVRLAEETGLIIPIGYWVLKRACLFIKELHARGYSALTVSANISVAQLMQNDFVESLRQIVAASGINPAALGLEITESVLADSFDLIIGKLQAIRNLGISIHLDDFGTGYSSLTYLKKLPIDIVKIDKSFMDGMQEQTEKELTESIIEMAHRLGLKTVAEGVETEYQLAKLKQYQCDIIQGYFISKPVPEEQTYSLVEKLL